MGGLLYLVQRGGAWAGWGPTQSSSRCDKCNSPSINGQYTNFIIFDVVLYTVLRQKQPLTFCRITRRKSNQFEWKCQTKQPMKCWFKQHKNNLYSFKVFFISSDVNRTSVKVSFQQWNLPLTINISLIGCEWKNTQMNACSRCLLTDDEVLMG